MKPWLIVLMNSVVFSVSAYSQTYCDCFSPIDSTVWFNVPMLLGPDTGTAPYYRCNECSTKPIVLPFSFCFYGKSYDTVYINNKGSISFNKPVFNFPATGFPKGGDTAMLAPFLSDIDDSVLLYTYIFYKISPTNLMVQWNGVGYQTFDDDLYNNFQITITNGSDSVLPPGNNVSFCYYLMQWATGDSSGGSGGFNGIPGTVGVNKGDGTTFAQISRFNYPGTTYNGSFDTANGLYFLNNKSFTFNTCVTGSNISPININPNLCNFDTVCVNDTLPLSASFLCSQQGQTVTLSIDTTGVQGFYMDTSSAHSIYTASCTLIPVLNDTGEHIITITATDNSTPVLTNTFLMHVFIKNCDSLSGISPITQNKNTGDLFELSPSPCNGKFEIKISPLQNSFSHIEIFTIFGKEIYHTEIPEDRDVLFVDITGRESGLYFVRLTGDTGIQQVKKLIIQK